MKPRLSRIRSLRRSSRPELKGHFGEEILVFTERDIQQNAKARFNDQSLIRIVLKQAFYEKWFRTRKHVTFRHSHNDAALDAYSAMDPREFEGINARQNWANWRTVPRNLSEQIPNRPIMAIDLCSGAGHSTAVLAYYLHPESKILGLEYNPTFVELARAKTYVHASGRKVEAEFRAQSVLETFRDPQGERVGDSSVDMVNSCGAVGHHFDPGTTRRLAGEVARVVRPGGLALIDSGSAGTPSTKLIEIFAQHGFYPVHSARSCWADSFLQICFKKRTVQQLSIPE